MDPDLLVTKVDELEHQVAGNPLGHKTTTSSSYRVKQLATQVASVCRKISTVGDVAAGLDPSHFGPAWVVVKGIIMASADSHIKPSSPRELS